VNSEVSLAFLTDTSGECIGSLLRSQGPELY
jgi:hypothetical protein